eukprot:SAG11_NODE_9262_length_927_cov_3.655797_1_plen_56_part_10
MPILLWGRTRAFSERKPMYEYYLVFIIGSRNVAAGVPPSPPWLSLEPVRRAASLVV